MIYTAFFAIIIRFNPYGYQFEINLNKIKKLLTGLVLSLFLVNLVIADSSTTYTIDISELNNGGTLSSSASYKANGVFIGFVDSYFGYSTSYISGSGLSYLEQLCGNDILEFGETCDDGNTTSGDGCSNVCLLENVCGNGSVEAGEACDDGNTTSGDGCSYICSIETGWTCSGDPSVCSPVCGDNIITGSEQCDDGNTTSGDGCSSTCDIETLAGCGNGILEAGEQCDDGNLISRDGCSSTCGIEIFLVGGGGVVPLCGNGIREGDEQCDDGNNVNGDGCDSICRSEEPGEELRPAAEEIPRTIKIKARPEKRVSPIQNGETQAKLVFYNKTLRTAVLETSIDINNIGWGILETDRLPEGTYNISIKGLSHLTKVMRNVIIDSENHTFDFTFGENFYLIAGDVHKNKDNFVNGLDISAAIQMLYGNNIHADLNRDGIVNGLDISIVVNNLYIRGQKI